MPGVGLEPTRIAPADFKSAASAYSATPAKNLEATTGFEPVNSGFADRRLIHLATSPLPQQISPAFSLFRLPFILFRLGRAVYLFLCLIVLVSLRDVKKEHVEAGCFPM